MVIGGGCCNVLTQNDQNQHPMVIGGGQCNNIGGAGGVIGGGTNNVGGGYNINWTTIGGGYGNTASNQHSSIGGGVGNTASAYNSSIVGGCCNVASGLSSISGGFCSLASADYSVALGYAGCSVFQGQSSVSVSGQIYGFSSQKGLIQYSDFLVYDAGSGSSTEYASNTTYIIGTGNNPSNLTKPTTNKAWHVTAKWTMYIASFTGTTTGINVGDALYGTTSFGYRSGAGGFVTSAITNNTATNNVNLNTGGITFVYGASGDIQTNVLVPTFAGGGTLLIRPIVKFELVETLAN
jgi:hypothetical protein